MPGKKLPAVLAAALTCTFAWSAAPAAEKPSQPVGVVSHILVLSDKCQDVSSPAAWKKAYVKDGASGHEKAMAIWKTVVRYRHQTNPSNEWLSPERNVHDPLKTIHVYGYGMCCCATSNVCGLARYLGMEARGRTVVSHITSEVRYDGGWHMIDGSLMNYFLKPDGKIASSDEIAKAVRTWHEETPGYSKKVNKLLKFAAKGNWKKKGPPLLATYPYCQPNGRNLSHNHGWHATMLEYDYQTAGNYECWPSMGYRLNVQLREGERLTRNWFNKGKVIDWTDADIMAGGARILGLQRKLGDKAPGRIGNGVLEYDVPLADGAFRRGALTADNLACTAEDKAAPAVHVKDANKSGVLILRMPTSYVYLSGTVDLKAVVGAGGGVVVSYSENHGRDWKQVAEIKETGSKKIDLSMSVFRKYAYRLKVELKGKGTGLEALKITHDVQHSQAPLPTLREGKNTIAFSAGPQEGTITLEANTAPGAASGRQVNVMNFHPKLNGVKPKFLRIQGTGDATFSIPAPGEITGVRMNLGYRCRDAKDFYTVSVSFDGGETFKQVGVVKGPTPGCTKYMTFSDVPAGARTALVKLAGREVNTTCLFGLRIDVDYKEPAGGFRPVKVTYVWDEGGRKKTHVRVCKTPRETYEISCGPKTTVKSFIVELDR